METVLKENDIVNIEEAGRYLVVKTVELDNQAYHYMIKLKEDQDNPEMMFVYETIDGEEDLDLVAVTDAELLAKLVELIQE
jgi:hypothetical protein